MANYLATDTDLTAVADAIRAKGGTSGPLAFPQGFVDAIDDIEAGGGGYTLEDINDGLVVIPEEVVLTGTKIGKALFAGSKTLRTISGPLVTTVTSPTGASALGPLYHCTGLVSASFPKITSLLGENDFFNGCSSLVNVDLKSMKTLGSSEFLGCSALQGIVLPALNGDVYATCFSGCTALRYFDAIRVNLLRTQAFKGCQNLNLIILRGASKSTLSDINNFAGTPFASGGSGGTIYIPKALYDHLGDGTALDYKAATNWSTIDGYGTITWAQIEGSIYETQYADGTPIPTT